MYGLSAGYTGRMQGGSPENDGDDSIAGGFIPAICRRQLGRFPLGNCKALKGTRRRRIKTISYNPFSVLAEVCKGGIFKGAGTRLL